MTHISNPYPKLHKVALLLFVLPFYLNAQKSDETTITTSFSCVSADTRISDLKYLSSGRTEEISVYIGARSKVVKYKGPQNLVFFRESESEVDDSGDPLKVVVGRVTLSGEEDRYLLFFTKDNTREERYRINALPDSLNDFSGGTYRFLNFAPYRIALKLGDTTQFLEKHSVTDVNGDFEHGNYYQTVMLSLPDGETPVPAYSGRMYFNEYMRMLYVLQPAPSGKLGRLKFTGIPDRVTD